MGMLTETVNWKRLWSRPGQDPGTPGNTSGTGNGLPGRGLFEGHELAKYRLTQKPHLHIVVMTVIVSNDLINYIKNKDLFTKLLPSHKQSILIWWGRNLYNISFVEAESFPILVHLNVVKGFYKNRPTLSNPKYYARYFHCLFGGGRGSPSYSFTGRREFPTLYCIGLSTRHLPPMRK